ncbi:hypothetical protein AB1Y20_013266 [Prymnesium parvum]|uniref:PH domain-containing protein n=1 Tax=Prymnesium parvum TaxID=97485 RepID=A0AB34IK39_PRYPA
MAEVAPPAVLVDLRRKRGPKPSPAERRARSASPQPRVRTPARPPSPPPAPTPPSRASPPARSIIASLLLRSQRAAQEAAAAAAPAALPAELLVETPPPAAAPPREAEESPDGGAPNSAESMVTSIWNERWNERVIVHEGRVDKEGWAPWRVLYSHRDPCDATPWEAKWLSLVRVGSTSCALCVSSRQLSKWPGGPPPLKAGSSPTSPSVNAIERIPLGSAQCARCPSGIAVGKRPHAFVVHARGRDFFFSVETNREVEEWLEAIGTAIDAMSKDNAKRVASHRVTPVKVYTSPRENGGASPPPLGHTPSDLLAALSAAERQHLSSPGQHVVKPVPMRSIGWKTPPGLS